MFKRTFDFTNETASNPPARKKASSAVQRGSTRFNAHYLRSFFTKKIELPADEKKQCDFIFLKSWADSNHRTTRYG
jgi:hypothetical protein